MMRCHEEPRLVTRPAPPYTAATTLLNLPKDLGEFQLQAYAICYEYPFSLWISFLQRSMAPRSIPTCAQKIYPN